MSRFRMGPAPQPYQRRTAKNVMDASSLPVSSCSVTVVSCFTRASTAGPLVASRMADVQKASRSSALCRAANSQASRTNSVSSCWPGVGDVAVAVEVLHERQGPLVRGERHRPRAGVGIHQQEVDSIGPDIEDA